VLPENSDPDAHRVDIPGTFLGAAAITSIAFAVILAESSGFGAPIVIALLAVCVASIAGFIFWEHRAAHPLLDLKFLRVPEFLTANVLAFCAYFATFAVFFFTALYLEEVVGDTGYQIAELFLPMMVLMVLASVLAGIWTITAGLRWSMLVGCLLFSGGLLLTAIVINPHPGYLPLAASLALAGIGVGATVVPATSSALSSVPPERSGMAASATNTSREIGAVTGVAVLGALVAARLQSDLSSSLQHLGLSKGLQQYVISGVESGLAPSGGNTSGVGPAGQGSLVTKVIDAAYSAFQSGLHAALILSAILVLVAGIFSFVLLGRRAAGESGVAPESAALRD
jgi:MFS family permease